MRSLKPLDSRELPILEASTYGITVLAIILSGRNICVVSLVLPFIRNRRYHFAQRLAMSASIEADLDTSSEDASAEHQRQAKRPRRQSDVPSTTAAAATTATDLYLDSIDRTTLDFDFEKLCSVTLSTLHLYCCLTCGKYFRGRGPGSPAAIHSVQFTKHKVYLNLTTKSFYILPENYPVVSSTLGDITQVLDPTYTPDQVTACDYHTEVYDLNRKPYIQGFVGLNNVRASGYVNVVVQALVHVKPIRDFFLSISESDSNQPKSNHPQYTPLVLRFAELTRKIWNPRLFKAQVSPQEFLQQVLIDSDGKFSSTTSLDPAEFLSWLFNKLHKQLGGSKSVSTIITRTFQGSLRVESQEVRERDDRSATDLSAPVFEQKGDTKITVTPFLFLTLDLPTLPVFQASTESAFIPQATISDVLAKYNGSNVQETSGVLRRFKLLALPDFLILHIKRFVKNRHVQEKNFTVLNYPLVALDMAECRFFSTHLFD